jgi:mannosylglycerate hydrolase
VKKAEKEDALIVRVFNPSRTQENDTVLSFYKNIKEAHITNLNEEIQSSVEVVNNKINIKGIKPCQPITVMVKIG